MIRLPLLKSSASATPIWVSPLGRRERRGERAGALLQGLDPLLERLGLRSRPAGLPGRRSPAGASVASCIGVRGRTRATAKSDGRGGSSPSQRLPRA